MIVITASTCHTINPAERVYLCFHRFYLSASSVTPDAMTSLTNATKAGTTSGWDEPFYQSITRMPKLSNVTGAIFNEPGELKVKTSSVALGHMDNDDERPEGLRANILTAPTLCYYIRPWRY